jgi:hypothetical protein
MRRPKRVRASVTGTRKARWPVSYVKGASPLETRARYFENVTLLPELRKYHAESYLALFLNHSAMFQLVNGSKETMREAFSVSAGQLEIGLGISFVRFVLRDLVSLAVRCNAPGQAIPHEYLLFSRTLAARRAAPRDGSLGSARGGSGA